MERMAIVPHKDIKDVLSSDVLNGVSNYLNVNLYNYDVKMVNIERATEDANTRISLCYVLEPKEAQDNALFSVNLDPFGNTSTSLITNPPEDDEEYMHICIYDEDSIICPGTFEIHGMVKAQDWEEARELIKPFEKVVKEGRLDEEYPGCLVGEKSHRKYYRITL